MNIGAAEQSYERHSSGENANTTLPSCYVAPDTIDAWRHRRMLDWLQPLLTRFPNAEWLTLGDGNFGSDAHYLQSNGAQATASSLTDSTLKLAFARGYLKRFCAQNAEKLSFGDETFDFVMCKEAYHHFPRPPIAFYEMWRVAKRAIVLIEPTEGSWRLLSWMKESVKRMLRGDGASEFEPCGNFLFRINLRELRKMAVALNGDSIAYRFFNDFYFGPAAHSKALSYAWGAVFTRLGILIQDLLGQLGLLNYGLACVILFKNEADQRTRSDLKRAGFAFSELPRNPYL